MSLVIAVRDKDRIVFGSDKQTSTGNTNKSHDATKIWEVPDLPGAIMGSVGSVRCSQIIQYNKLIDLNDAAESGIIDTKFIINSVVPVIMAQLQANGVTCSLQKDEDNIAYPMIPNVFLFAYGNQAWMIWHDLSVTELGDYLAIGSGSDVANGALFATKNKNPFERITTSIDAAAESTLFVDDGIDFLATKYYPKDGKLIAAALGVDPTTVIFEEN